MKVLVVDDYDCQRDLMQDFLSGFFAEVLLAKNGYEGLKTMEANPDLSLVISDLEMPVLNGFDMIALAKKNSKIREIPIIIITASITNEVSEKARELGVYFMLTKPIRSFNFLERLLTNFK